MTPKRQIIRSYGNPLNRRTRRGVVKTTTLECGHVVDTNTGERNRGWTYCHDCYYGKPVPSYTAITEREFVEFCDSHDGEPMAGRPARRAAA